MKEYCLSWNTKEYLMQNADFLLNVIWRML